MKENKLSLILLSITLLLLVMPMAYAETYVKQDGKCDYSLGETRHNSPEDCKLEPSDYIDCIKEKDSCSDESVWNEIHYFLGSIILLLLYLRHQRQSKTKVLNKRKKRNYTSHYHNLPKRNKKRSLLRYKK